MKEITYEQNGISHTVNSDFAQIAPALLWRVFLDAKDERIKKTANDLHGIICAMCFDGEISIK